MDTTTIFNIVIIRFSVRLSHFNIFEDDEARTNWFIFRSKLFENYLYKCLQHQTKKPNKVYLLVDKGDQHLVNRYLNLSNIDVLYVNPDMKDYKQQLAVDLYKSKLTKNLVISRIDSDDLINKEFFHNINQQLLLHPTKRLVACKGYISDLSNIQSVFYPNSPFISEYINFDGILSASEIVKNLLKFSLFDSSHDTYVSTIEHVQNHNAEWMQLTHHTNISNKLLPPTVSTNNSARILCTPLIPIDHIWFYKWAGFQLENSINEL